MFSLWSSRSILFGMIVTYTWRKLASYLNTYEIGDMAMLLLTPGSTKRSTIHPVYKSSTRVDTILSQMES